MDDALRVRGVEAGGDLPRQLHRFGHRNWTTCDPVGKRLSLDELHDEEIDAILGADVVQRADVEMLDGRDRARFALEPLQNARRAGDVGGQILIATARFSRVSRAR
jgi:hypothetical protein